MQLIRMSYKDFTFMVNPNTLKLSHSKSVASRLLPIGTSRNKEVNTNPIIISGTGYFAGKNARKYIRNLSKIFNEKGSGYLFLPDSTPIRAIFKRLDICYTGASDRIEYSFEFVQEEVGKASVMDFGYTFALDGENLFDVANRTNTDIDRIFSLNEYSDLFSVNEGDKIWLS